jgi:hypothetical protein
MGFQKAVQGIIEEESTNIKEKQGLALIQAAPILLSVE